MPDQPLSLAKQLELSRFQRALEVCESIAENRALLTTFELERVNSILAGKEQSNPWRDSPVTLMLPGGKTETLQLLSDPKITARDHLHRATETAENGHAVDAAVNLYADLVLSHVFKDANRRTAVTAAHYILKRYEIPITGLAIHEIGLGDLRETGHREELLQTVHQMVRFATRKP
jgi:hypothetical protein